MSFVLILDRDQVATRIHIVRKYGAALTGRKFGELMGSTDPSFAAKLEKGQGLSHDRMKLVAEVCAGKGVLKYTTPEEVLAFLEGRVDELKVSLDGTFGQMSYFGPRPRWPHVVFQPTINLPATTMKRMCLFATVAA